MVAGNGSWLGSALIDRHIAIIDPLLVHPLPAKSFFAGQHRRRI
jgi:hypothetical protein